jgi:alkylated DNA repair dioxygenase AlkB
LFPTESEQPAGLVYREEAISPDEERDCVRFFETLPFKPFEFHGRLGKRRVVWFGWRYDYGGRKLRKSDPMPEALLPLRDRAAAVAGLPTKHLAQILVTEYEADAGIGWHRDKATFGDVIAVSFLSSCRLRLRRRHGNGWQRWSIDVAPRSAYVLRGPSRHDWEHSVPPVEALRYSVTFRTLATD